MKRRSTHRPCASVVILRQTPEAETEVLLVHKPRKRDDWQIPQGGIEPNESLMTAARRELREETGVRLQRRLLKCPQTYKYNYPVSFKKREKPKYEGQLLIFVATSVPFSTAVIVDNREIDTFVWVKPQELSKYLQRKQYLKTVEEAVQWAISKLFGI